MRKVRKLYIVLALFASLVPALAQGTSKQSAFAATSMAASGTIEMEFGYPLYTSVSDFQVGTPKPSSGIALPFKDRIKVLSPQEKAELGASSLGRYRNPGAEYGTSAQTVKPILNGEQVYFQLRDGGFQGEGILPVQENVVAIHHENNYVSVYSTNEAVLLWNLTTNERDEKKAQFSTQDALWLFAGADSGGRRHYTIRICDTDKKSWVNPEIFLPFDMDTHSPKLSSVELLPPEFESRMTYPAQGQLPQSSQTGQGSRADQTGQAGKGREEYPQGAYLVAVQAFDVFSRGEQASGLYRFRLLVDGQVVFDKRLDMASIVAAGLSFLGSDAPSSKTVLGANTFVIGDYSFVAGIHTLDLTVYDYAGNYTRVSKEVRFW